MTGWTPLAKSLLESAKHEAPAAAAKAKVWSGVAASFAVGGATTGAVVSIAPPAVAGGGIAALASAKMLLVGALLGSAVTLGIAATTFYVRVQPVPPIAPAAAIAPVALRAATAFASTMTSEPQMPAGTPAVLAVAPAVAPRGMAAAIATGPNAAPTPATTGVPLASRFAVKPVILAKPAVIDEGEDPLMREASLVAEARSALRRGDPSAALAAIRSARALPSHQLAPEEGALEGQAQHALGHGSDPTPAGDAARAPSPSH